jgi:hypothetical protein
VVRPCKKKVPTIRFLDMSGSLYLTIGYLNIWYKGDEGQGPVSKSRAKMKALIVGTNIGQCMHEMSKVGASWPLSMQANWIHLSTQQGRFKGGIGKSCNIRVKWPCFSMAWTMFLLFVCFVLRDSFGVEYKQWWAILWFHIYRSSL